MFGSPLANSGGVDTVIGSGKSGEVKVPLLPSSHLIAVL
jgi:hypothetical protein